MPYKLITICYNILLVVSVIGVWFGNVHALQLAITLIAIGLIMVNGAVSILFGLLHDIATGLDATKGLKTSLEGMLKLLKEMKPKK